MNNLPPSSLQPDPNSMGPVDGEMPQGAPFHLQRLFTFLLKFWWLPALTLLLGLGAAVGFILWKPPTFVSRARMWETVKLRLPEGSLFTDDLQNGLGTHTDLLQSGKLRQLALARLRTASNSIPLGKDGQPLEVFVRPTQPAKSGVIAIEATSSDAAYTQAYLDALLDEYLKYKKNVRALVSGGTLASIEEQVLTLERDLKTAQDAFTAFQTNNNLVVLQEEGTIAGGYLARLHTQRSDYLLEYQLLKAATAEQEAASSGKTNANLDLIESVRGSPSGAANGPVAERQSASRELVLLKLQREKLSRFMRPKHPKIVKLDADIERAQKIMDIFQNQSREQLAASRQALEMKMTNVTESIEKWQAKVIDANSRLAEAERLKMNMSRIQIQYERLANLQKNVDLSRKIDVDTLAVLEPASVAIRSHKQDIQLLAMAVVGGLAAGIGLVFLIALRDDRFTSIAEVTEKLAETIVGQVPEVRPLQRGARVPLLEMDDQRHMYAESYRNLRSALIYMPAESQRPKVVLVTSAMPNEGKSTVAVNLARTLALGGARVLLVDGDLRKGILHDVVKLERQPGLSDLLGGTRALPAVLQSNSIPNLTFISRGASTRTSCELFLDAAFDRFLAEVRQQFDYVLIDSSPVFAADDVTTLAPKADGTLFVVRSSFSSARAVQHALELLYQRQAKVLGLVFTRAKASSGSYYYYKYADYYQPAEKE